MNVTGEMVPIKNVFAHPANPRSFATVDANDLKLCELAETIKLNGVLQPLLGRPHPEKKGKIQLCAGERRLRAAILAGLTEVPVIVRDVTDAEALEIMITENLQREDLLPLEEANAVQTLLQGGWSIESAASQLGKSPFWVRRRRALIHLSLRWKEAIADPEHIVRMWSVAHFETVAHFGQALQDDILEMLECNNLSVDQVQKPSGFRKALGKMLRLLKHTPWDLAETDLGGMPACEGCPIRSDCEGDLFGESDGSEAVCLDPDCWQRKERAFGIRKVEEVRAKHADALPIYMKEWNQDPPSFEGTSFAAEVVSANDFVECKKSEKGAQRCVIVHAGAGRYEVGEVKWMRPCSTDSGRSGKEKTALTPLKDRRLRYEKLRAKIVAGKLADLLGEMIKNKTEIPNMDDHNLHAALVIFGTKARAEFHGSDDWKQFTAEKAASDGVTKLQKSLLEIMIARIQSFTDALQWAKILLNLDELRSIAGFVGVDIEDLIAQALEEKPDPKSWANLNEDGTPKAKKKPKAKAKAKPKAKPKAKKKPPTT